MLEDPRELLALVEFPLIPLDAPPKALRLLAPDEPDVCRLPTRSPPPPRLALMSPARGDGPAPEPPLPPVPRSIVPA